MRAAQVLVLFMLAVSAIIGGFHVPRRVDACTPGPPLYPLEEIARADAIAIVRAESVRGPENSAPTVTPEVSSPPVATAPPDPTSADPFVDGMPPDFSLEGYGATLRVEREITTGLPSSFRVDEVEREQLEQTVRTYEAGKGSNCPVSDPRTRYYVGVRYLVFLRMPASGPSTLARFELEGGNLLVAPETFGIGGEATPLYASALNAARFFPSAPFTAFEGQAIGQVTAQSVPLDSMLRAVAVLRDDPSIAPPDTGSAGLKHP